MNHEISGTQGDGIPPAATAAMLGIGQAAQDIDLWLRRNVRVCSQQEYLRYRAYLETARVPSQAYSQW